MKFNSNKAINEEKNKEPSVFCIMSLNKRVRSCFAPQAETLCKSRETCKRVICFNSEKGRCILIIITDS